MDWHDFQKLVWRWRRGTSRTEHVLLAWLAIDQNLDLSKMDNFSELLLKQVIDSNSNVDTLSLITFFADPKHNILDFPKMSCLQYSIVVVFVLCPYSLE
jgi:hypothetical protein